MSRFVSAWKLKEGVGDYGSYEIGPFKLRWTREHGYALIHMESSSDIANGDTIEELISQLIDFVIIADDLIEHLTHPGASEYDV